MEMFPRKDPLSHFRCLFAVFQRRCYHTHNGRAGNAVSLTGGEVRIIGIIRLDYVDWPNRENAKMAITRLKNASRNEFVAVRDKERAMACRNRSNPAGASRSNATVGLWSGFAVWKGTKHVMFFTKDLNGAPFSDLLFELEESAVKCVRSLVGERRLAGDEVLHRNIVRVPEVIVAYDFFMNSAHQIDQLRTTSPTQRKERRLYVDLVTWIVDLTMDKAFAKNGSYAAKLPPASALFKAFKRCVMNSFVGHILKSSWISSVRRSPPTRERLFSET